MAGIHCSLLNKHNKVVLRMSNKLVKNDTIQYKALKLRIYPTEEQEILINKTFGCCRQIYNEHLQERNEFYINNILHR